MAQPLRFGMLVLQHYAYPEMVERWQTLEALGFDSVWIGDHYVDPWLPNDPWYDAWALLPALAVVTSRIHIGTLVTSTTLHHPAKVAKQAMTVDHIANGRLILGIGAGRVPLDHSMLGLPYWEKPERVHRFQEFVEIIRQLLGNRVSSYQGNYYRVKEAVMNPAPLQQPLPLMLAAHGKATLKLTARFANIWNTFLRFDATPDEALEIAHQQNRELDESCATIGRDPTTLSRSLLCGLTQDALFASEEAFLAFVGHYREAGFNDFIFYWTGEEPHPVFPNLHKTTITNRATLEWVAEACAKLRGAE